MAPKNKLSTAANARAIERELTEAAVAAVSAQKHLRSAMEKISSGENEPTSKTETLRQASGALGLLRTSLIQDLAAWEGYAQVRETHEAQSSRS